jgi:hypothetical protein
MGPCDSGDDIELNLVFHRRRIEFQVSGVPPLPFGYGRQAGVPPLVAESASLIEKETL